MICVVVNFLNKNGLEKEEKEEKKEKSKKGKKSIHKVENPKTKTNHNIKKYYDIAIFNRYIAILNRYIV